LPGVSVEEPPLPKLMIRPLEPVLLEPELDKVLLLLLPLQLVATRLLQVR
jgi:hypothetical protein